MEIFLMRLILNLEIKDEKDDVAVLHIFGSHFWTNYYTASKKAS